MSAGGPKPSAFYVERQALTRSPATPAMPSGLDSAHAAGQGDPGPGNPTAGDGLILTGLTSVVVSLYPNTGQSITGGTLLCWIFNPFQAQWTRAYDFDIAITAGTYPAVTFGALREAARLGMIMNFLTSGITGPTGADVLVRLDGFVSVLGMAS